MISAQSIAQLAKKWQRMAAFGWKRLTTTAATIPKGAPPRRRWPARAIASCTVYAADAKRFKVPLTFLGTAVFGELLRMSQEEFGFAGDDGRTTLLCDAAVMEYALCLLRRNASAEMEKAFLSSMAMPCHYANSAAPSLGVSQHVAVCSS